MSRRLVIGIVVLVGVQALALGIYLWKRSAPQPTKFAAETLSAASAPELAFERADGSHSSLAESRGKVVLVHFWATWCKPCREELPGLLALAKERELSIVAVSVDDSWEQIRTYFGGNVPSVIARPLSPGVHRLFGASTMPDTYLVDGNGRLTQRYAGARDWRSEAARSHLSRTVAELERP